MQNHSTNSNKYTNVMRHADGSLDIAYYLNRAQDERANANQALAQLFAGWVRKN